MGGWSPWKDNIVLIGARQDDTSIEDAGQAHVFDAVTGNLLQTLNDPTPAEDERFGTAVAIGGDYLVVGAYRHHTEQRIDAGQVQVFSNDFGARPFFDDQAFGVSENSADGTVVGTLAANDADGDAISFAITTNVDPDGDGNDAFRLEGHQVVVNDADDFDYEANAQLVVTAVASDGSLADTAQITVNVTDIDEVPVVNLVGNVSLTVPRSDTASYTDAGATAFDAEDGEITGSIVVSGDTVDLTTLGTYLIQFDVQDSAGNNAASVIRTVSVIDMTAPVITLNGSDTETVEAGFPYTDPGASASDSLDGDVSGSVVVSGAVDPAALGTYVLTYNVQDAAGNAADPVTRTVTVQDTLRPVIALSYDTEVLQVSDQSDTGLGGQANAPAGLPTETSLGVCRRCGAIGHADHPRPTEFTQPDGTPVTSRQEWNGVAPGRCGQVSSSAHRCGLGSWRYAASPTSESIVLIDQRWHGPVKRHGRSGRLGCAQHLSLSVRCGGRFR